MRQQTVWLISGVLLVLSQTWLGGTELTWVPINPSFGGNSFNASWMMSQAEIQNTFTDKASSSSHFYSQDPLDNFKDSLNRQILSRLASQLVKTSFGEDSLQPGHYEIGDYIIEVVPGDDGINVSIFDNGTGNQTNIIVPYY